METPTSRGRLTEDTHVSLDRMIVKAAAHQPYRRDEGLVGRLGRGGEFIKRPDGAVARVCFLHPDSPGIVHVRCGHGRSLGQKQQGVKTEEQPVS